MENNKNLYKKLHTILKEGISVGKSGHNAFHKYQLCYRG